MKPRFISLALVAGALLLPAAAQAAAPTATTGPATGVSYSGATLTGSINPNASETNYYFQYGASKAYGTQTVLTPLGHGTKTVPVSAPISGLLPDTTYHYRVVALGASTVRGADRAFTTPKIPLSLGLVTSINPVVFGGTFAVGGTLSGTGNGHREVDLQGNVFPYTAGFVNIGNALLTNADGSFLFPLVSVSANTMLRVVSPGKTTVTSPTITENVAVGVTLRVKRTHRRGFARLFGTVSPGEAGALVAFERLKPRRGFVTIGGTSVKAGRTPTTSQFSKVLRVRPGVYRVLVTVKDGGHVFNRSQSVVIR